MNLLIVGLHKVARVVLANGNLMLTKMHVVNFLDLHPPRLSKKNLNYLLHRTGVGRE